MDPGVYIQLVNMDPPPIYSYRLRVRSRVRIRVRVRFRVSVMIGGIGFSIGGSIFHG